MVGLVVGVYFFSGVMKWGEEGFVCLIEGGKQTRVGGGE